MSVIAIQDEKQTVASRLNIVAHGTRINESFYRHQISSNLDHHFWELPPNQRSPYSLVNSVPLIIALCILQGLVMMATTNSLEPQYSNNVRPGAPVSCRSPTGNSQTRMRTRVKVKVAMPAHLEQRKGSWISSGDAEEQGEENSDLPKKHCRLTRFLTHTTRSDPFSICRASSLLLELYHQLGVLDRHDLAWHL